MFGLFNKKNDSECPVNESKREWLENAFLWLLRSFGEDRIKNRKILKPNFDDFPIKYDGKHEPVYDTLKIVATQMEITPENIFLDIYSEGQTEISTGGPFGGRIFMKQVEGDKYSAGKYWGKQEDGKFHIALEEKELKEPEKIVATLAHEIAHIKLLGEERIKENNEPLTDLTTIIFGLGIFNANSAFRTTRGIDYWGYSKLGYLSQMEWGYALALYAYFREEKTPEWINFLSTNVKSDFKKSERFIFNNPEKIFQKNL